MWSWCNIGLKATLLSFEGNAAFMCSAHGGESHLGVSGPGKLSPGKVGESAMKPRQGITTIENVVFVRFGRPPTEKGGETEQVHKQTWEPSAEVRALVIAEMRDLECQRCLAARQHLSKPGVVLSLCPSAQAHARGTPASSQAPQSEPEQSVI